jgi:hypothetical protein
MTLLDPQVRGDPFTYHGVLGNGWTQASFSEMRFTLRERTAASTTITDTDAVDQALKTASEIVFTSDTAFTVSFPSSRTTEWPAKLLKWDLQGTVAGSSPVASRTIDYGEIVIVPDVTRAP